MNAQLHHIHQKIAALSYRIDGLPSGFSGSSQPVASSDPAYFVGQLIESCIYVSPGTHIGRCVFFPCDGGQHEWKGVTYSTPDLRGRIVRSVLDPQPGGNLEYNGELGQVTSHRHMNGFADDNPDFWGAGSLYMDIEKASIGAYGITAPGLHCV